MLIQYGPLAQAVEHMTFNHVVRGSSPRWFTNAPLAQLVEQLTLNQWVLGSSPRRCTKQKRVAKSLLSFVFVKFIRGLERVGSCKLTTTLILRKVCNQTTDETVVCHTGVIVNNED